MLETILAKTSPKESMVEHIDRAMTIWKELRDRFRDKIGNEQFWEDSYISVFFHDFGKITGNVQDRFNNSNRYAEEEYIRHEFVSGLFLFLLNSKYYSDRPLSLLAIFSHHKTLDYNLFQADSRKNLKIDKRVITDYLKYYSLKADENTIIGQRSDEVVTAFCKTTLSSLYSVYKTYIYNSYLDNYRQHSRVEYIHYKALLTISDWVASGGESLPEHLSYDQSFLKQRVCQKLIKEKKLRSEDDFKYRKFQLESEIEGNVIAVAPTGSGKTEAALLWAMNREEGDKIFYLLPTKVTSNAIYRRLTGYFDKENVAVVHSSAYYFLKSDDVDFDRLKYLKDKTFFKNVTVCTIDQVLTQGFNLGYWELKTFSMLNARIIIDEIHLYQPYTLGLIIATIRYLIKHFNSKFYIMSATIPSKLKGLLLDALESNNEKAVIIKDSELLNSSRNRFEIRDCSVDELDDEISKELKEGKKVLIIVNTVDEAIRLYDIYKDKTENKICYHSRFTKKDRVEQEKLIHKGEESKEPVLLIATQVVEVSLDIDFDVIFTENAPIDAIIQRAGRVNRARKKSDSRLVIFKHREVSDIYVYNEVEGLLDRTFEIFRKHDGERLTEQQLLDFVDLAYENYDIADNESYLKGLKSYKEVQEQYSYILDNLAPGDIFTREGLDTISVIPEIFKKQLEGASIQEKSLYEVNVRKSRVKKSNTSKDRHGFVYIKDVKYTKEKGLEFIGEGL